MEHPIKILERYWNFTSFRPNQETIINAVISGEDTFALLPTGGGKSLCFQIPALAKPGICIVISPLVALMKDQVKALNNKGIKAMALTSGISYQELDTLLDNCVYGNYKFLYLSPERLQQELVQERIKQMPVNLIAVDEAHCISQWGNDFRPAYKNITLLRQLQPSVNVIALTASARPEVVEDIIKELDFINPKIFKQSFFRPNLAYMVFTENDKYYRIETILKKYTASSIIYVRNRKLTLELSQFLENKGIRSTYFHGGITNTEKETHMQQWLSNQKQVMVATNAFGMGIDKPDVKTVIHLDLPESMESYFQEAGRVGRNGEKAFAVILKNTSDESKVKNQFLNVLPDVNFIKQVYRKLCNYFQISYGEGEYFTQDFNFNTFCKTYSFNSIMCYNALQLLDRNSIISLSKQFNNKATLQIIISNAALFSYLETHKDLNIIVKSILRMYGGVFEHETKINTTNIAEKASVNDVVLMNALKKLEADNIISLKLVNTDAQITFLQPREDDKTINRIASIIEKQNKLKQNQVKSILNYVENDSVCKSMQLLTYFGETDIKPCGICSVCIQSNKTKPPLNPIVLKKQVIELLEHGDLSSRILIEKLNCTEKEIQNVLQLMLEHNIIAITKTNTYKLYHL
ncbi:recombinase RecQ [Pseudalgibacter alginicilyticus]|uniref:ATP-dependent DNA helicase RecQ n=1 Tax=Pseudalgibacter alginicilyticus TaxID=1736674 RepID=A0A0P0CQ02_9FLAO|nr:RecQ family ATP-dependent DNA helicase [Pseudalgibacter alginicilyticus]ALJ06514.1 recombinase RecQ [Pseudalgibacter alginicilyticus]